jgi:DNA-binding transcriptional LysR family regulator
LTVELRQLRYFVAVAEAGQISAAARALHLAQPALTQAMHGLERAVGTALLERHPRGVTLTAAGARLLTGARATIDACDRAVAEARELAPTARVLRIGAISCTPGLGAMLHAFRVEHPDFRLRLVPVNFLEDPVAVANGDVDVAFNLPDYGLPGVLTETLVTLPVFVCYAVNHRLAGRATVHLEEIGDDVFPGQHAAMTNAFSDLFYLTAPRGRRPPTIAHSPLTPDATWAMVASGEVITTTPMGAWAGAPDRIAVSQVIDVPPFPLRIAWRAGSDAAVNTFVDFIREQFGATDWQTLLMAQATSSGTKPRRERVAAGRPP